MKIWLVPIIQQLFCARTLPGHHSAKFFTLILTLILLGLAGIQASSGLPQAQGSDEWRNQVQEVLRDTAESFARFRAMRQEAQQLREQERARVSDYTAALAKATSALQKHVADLHPRQTNCQACRKQVKELRTLIKRIGQILE
jgi:type II secretory pathway pseudopilin PulG